MTPADPDRDDYAVREERQHRGVLGDAAVQHDPPAAGPVAVLPTPRDFFVRAVEQAGGTVAPLSEETTGIVWLSNKDPEGLARALSENPRVSWVQLPWAGIDAFSHVVAEAARPGLVFTSAKGAYAQPVAEHALALTLALLRLLPQRALARTWEGGELGTSLFGLSVVIIGAGGITTALLRLLEPFGVRTTVVRRAARPVAGADRTVATDSLLDVLPDADVLIVAAALTEQTRGLIDARALDALPSTAVLVNIARGPIVDTDDLVTALSEGRIAGAGLDVTDPEPLPDGHPLWSLPSALITPHAADTPEMTAPLLADRIAENVRAIQDGRPLVGVVDPAAGY